MKSAAALIVFALAAGCLADPTTETPDDTAPPADEIPRFPTPTLVDKGGDAETSHVVSQDGNTILVCSHGGFTQPSPLWASEDGGLSFRRLFPSPSPPVGGDCDLAIADDGSWYIIYDTLLSITVAGTSDKGRTWRFAYVTDPLLTNVDRPWIEAVGRDLYITYADLMSSQPIVLMFSKSSDGGRTWSAPVIVTLPPGPMETNCWVGKMVTKDAGRTVRIPLNCWRQDDSSSSNKAIYFANSNDAGATWTLEQVAEGIGVPTASYGTDGSLWLTYVSVAEASRDILARVAVDGSLDFGSPILVERLPPGAFDWTWIDARPDGSASVAWMSQNGTAPATTLQPFVARVEPAAASPSFVESVGPAWAGTTTFEFFMVKHDATGAAYVVYPLGGDGCKVSPPGTGTGSTRNDLCVHFVKETLLVG